MIDDVDRQILKIVQENARTTNADIARRVGMAPSAIFERVKKLEASGLIKGYHARVDGKQVGLGLVAFVFVRSEGKPGTEETGERISQFPEVQEVHHVAGEDCFLVKVRAKDPEALGQILRERFGGIEAIRSTRTTIVLNTLKESSDVPLDKV